MHLTNHQSRITSHVGNELRENTMFNNGKAISTPVIPEKLQALSGIQKGLLGLAVFTASLLLTPSPTLAADECGTQVDSGNPESFDCPDASYASGVTYEADGDLTIDFNNDATSTIGGTGITLTGDGGENITFDSNDPTTTIRSLSGMDGDLLGITTVDGDIVITTSVMDGDTNSAADVDRAVFAQSTGTGGIDITTTGLVDALSSTNPATSIGIEAITGSGSLTIAVSDDVAGNMGAIDATTGTGDLVIDILSTGSTDIVNGQNGNAIRANVGGDAVISVGSGRVLRNQGDSGTAVLNVTAAGNATINNNGSITPNGQGQAIEAGGGSLILNNNGAVNGWMDISGLGGSFTFNNDGSWDAGKFTVTDLSGSSINNAGTILVGNAGNVISGQPFGPNRIVAPGAAYVGEEGSVLDLEVFFDGRSQDACDENGEVGACLDLTGGSTEGTTAILVSGNTTTLVSGPLTTFASVNSGIVLVDVSGGTSGADDFTLHPGSCLFTAGVAGCQPAYTTDPVYGAVMDVGGLLDYALLYNPATQQHVLASVPGQQAVEYVTYIEELLSIWHTTSDTVASRQAALRDGATGKLWFRVTGENSERDAAPTFATQGNSFTYDRKYSLDTRTAIVGGDLVSGEDHVIGLHIGLIRARMDFDDSNTHDDLDGATFGAYGGWWHDSGLSVDGTVNANFLKLDHAIAGDLEKTESDTLTLGARAEVAWRLPLLDNMLYVQPLATVAYATSDIEEIGLQDNTLNFEDATSLRGAVGVRLGGGMDLNASWVSRLGYWLTVRGWDEQADEGEVRFSARDGNYLAIEDDRSGTFQEVDLGLSAANAEDTFSMYLSGGAEFADEIDSNYNFSVGARFLW